jgi:hypothetical protein
MNANLMRSPSLQPTFDQRIVLITLQYLKMRYGMTAIQDDCLFLAIFFGTTQRRINRSLLLF